MIDAALLLPKMLARTGDNAELTEITAKIAWRRVAGEGLREHAVPIGLSDKTLVVSVADTIWQKQLQTMSAELIFRINKLLQRRLLEGVEFRIDPPRPGNERARHQSRPRVRAPLPDTIVSAAAGIEDPELRQRFLRAAENCLVRRDTIKSAVNNRQSQM